MRLVAGPRSPPPGERGARSEGSCPCRSPGGSTPMLQLWEGNPGGRLGSPGAGEAGRAPLAPASDMFLTQVVFRPNTALHPLPPQDAAEPHTEPKAGLSRSPQLSPALEPLSRPPRDGPCLRPGLCGSLGGAGLFRLCPLAAGHLLSASVGAGGCAAGQVGGRSPLPCLGVPEGRALAPGLPRERPDSAPPTPVLGKSNLPCPPRVKWVRL